MTKGIFVDLDGTLLDNTKHISEYDKRVLGAVAKLGHKIILVTGKSFHNAITWYNELGLKTCFITSMGQVINNPSNPDFKPIIIHAKYDEIIVAISQLSKMIEVKNYLFETLDGNIFVKKLNNSHLEKLIARPNAQIKQLISDQGIDQVIGSYVEVGSVPYAELGQIVSNLNEQYENKLEFSYWVTENNHFPIVNIKPKHAGKSIAVRKVIDLEKIDYSISFGNGWNDRNMLHLTDESFAMCNAAPKVKAFAKSITEFDNNHSGVGVELAKHFKLTLPEK